MSNPILRRFANAEPLSEAAAHEFVDRARAAVAARGRFVVALSGGSTPRRLYQLLAAAPFRSQVDWPKVEFFWGDERAVPPDHPDSNYHMANEALLASLALPVAHVHRLPAERPDREAVAAGYQAELARVCAVPVEGPPPPFDLVLLGMGPDGHTASLFPHTAALKEQKRWVVPNHVPKLNADRLTLTVPILNRAAEILFLVAGVDKAEALAAVLEGPRDPQQYPSQLIQPVGKLLWYVDEAAAARLQGDKA